MIEIDVTDKMDFGDNDSEYLPITKCLCGKKFESWSFTISIYSDMADECPHCKRKFYFKNNIRVYEVNKCQK